MNADTPMVSICCITYNHEPYIRQCLEGFVMQKTNFKFEAIVHDDASTDHTADIIREYAAKYPNIIKPIYETENQYSKHDGSLRRIMDAACTGKYIALCEGDDYWIDPLKLQKQVDFLETHPEHSLCFTAHQRLFPDGTIQERRRYQHSVNECMMKDIILVGGGFMSTASMVYHRLKSSDYPDWRKNSPVGDLPLMLVLALNGKVGYINDVMSTSRRNILGSWTDRVSKDFEMFRRHHNAEKKMWKDFDVWTGYKFHKFVMAKVAVNDKVYLKAYIRRLFKTIIPGLK